MQGEVERRDGVGPLPNGSRRAIVAQVEDIDAVSQGTAFNVPCMGELKTSLALAHNASGWARASWYSGSSIFGPTISTAY